MSGQVIRRLDAFLMLHGRRALAWVGGLRKRHVYRAMRVEGRPVDLAERRIGMVRHEEGKGWVRG